MGMLRSVWPALNPLSIHVTFTAIVSGAYPGGQNVQKCAKMANFWTYGLNYWETVKDRWVYMLQCVWQALNPLFIHVTFTAIVPEAYPGEAKMCLRLSAETDARTVGDSHPSGCLYVCHGEPPKGTDWLVGLLQRETASALYADLDGVYSVFFGEESPFHWFEIVARWRYDWCPNAR